MIKSSVLVLDFGGQYATLLARRVRENGVYCEIHPYFKAEEKIRELNPCGIILSGGPQSVYKRNAAAINSELLGGSIPVLGVCYGAQLLAKLFGGKVEPAKTSEYGLTLTKYENSCPLFDGLDSSGITWMSHSDQITDICGGFEVIASTDNCAIAGFQNIKDNIFALQFHPEVNNTENGSKMLENFLFKICKAEASWQMDSFIDMQISKIKEQVKDKKVILGLSGGVDSSVCAALLSQAIGSRLTCVFVDTGLMRKNEGDEIEAEFSKMDLNFVRINAGERFFKVLRGVRDPEKKRKAIGSEFVRVFEEVAFKVNADFLAQGTIYPDVIESGMSGGATIKSHHNVGGLPKDLGFCGVVEPLKSLFKDEVRKVGHLLGLNNSFINRQPFPGPGLGIRIIGSVSPKKADLLQQADWIFRKMIENEGLDSQIHQYFAVLTNVRSVGVMGDYRTYGYTLVLRGVTTSDFMTADFARIPYDVLAKISARIVNEVKGITRVVYDITTKPPSTIEWE